MAEDLHHDHRQAHGAHSLEIVALRLHLLAGMAAADGHMHEDEVEQLHTFISQSGLDERQQEQLTSMLAGLLEQPPGLEPLLRSIVSRVDRPDLAGLLIADLVAIANADGHIDAREEGLLRLVCGALEIDPVTLYDPPRQSAADVSREELAALVRSLLELDDT